MKTRGERGSRLRKGRRFLGVALAAVPLMGWPGPARALDRAALQTYRLPTLEAPAPAAVELGRLLFFDRRLSGDGTMNCATCHLPGDDGFADSRAVSAAYPTNAHFRNTPTAVNAALRQRLTWDGRAGSVEEQALGPIASPFEMNIQLDLLVEKLRGVPEYRERFRAALGGDVTAEGIAAALGAFERTLVSGPAPFDRWLDGEDGALTPAARRGAEVFFGAGACVSCHTGHQFGGAGYASLGLEPSPGLQEFPLRAVSLRYYARSHGLILPLDAEDDWGRGLVSGAPEDRGRFLVPTLRQLVRTAPYGHDGRFATLAAVIDLHDRGGGPAPHRSPQLRPLGLTPAQKADLEAFLVALTGPDPAVRPPRVPE